MGDGGVTHPCRGGRDRSRSRPPLGYRSMTPTGSADVGRRAPAEAAGRRRRREDSWGRGSRARATPATRTRTNRGDRTRRSGDRNCKRNSSIIGPARQVTSRSAPARMTTAVFASLLSDVLGCRRGDVVRLIGRRGTRCRAASRHGEGTAAIIGVSAPGFVSVGVQIEPGWCVVNEVGEERDEVLRS